MKQMMRKLLLCFTNISAKYFHSYFRLQTIIRAPYFGAFLPTAVAFKSIKISVEKCFVLDSKSAFIFSQTLAVDEFLAIL